jgi:hypothetical protein
MPKPSLSKPLDTLEGDIIDTLIAGLHEWRADLKYPDSYSDMQACVRGLLTMYEVKRRPLPKPLPSPCPECDGLGHYVIPRDGYRQLTACGKCHGTGKVYY